tara:strand:+ start:335 stop:1015 length:681 start_codon:yes stop_codon:yes gene_type:complete
MISVLVTTHNHGMFLKKCISSILKNDKKYLKEIIIVDDSSIDNTNEIINKLKKKNKKIKYFNVKFCSPARSKNYAAKNSRGKWITFIDGDDYVSKNYLKDYVFFLKKNNPDFVYTNIKILINEKILLEKQNRKGILYILNNPHGSGCLIKNELWRKVGGIDEKMKFQDDFNFWCKINFRKKTNIYYLNIANYIYRRHSYNRSKNYLQKYFYKLLSLFAYLFKKFNN